MVAALSHTFGISESELCQSVLQKFDESDFDVQTMVADWQNTRGVTRHQYARSIRGANSKVDGLFIWLVVQCVWQHLNLMHASGIWTSRRSEYVVMTDSTIVLMISGFLSVTRMDLASLLDDSDYLAQFKDPCETQYRFITVPQVLNKPVIDLGARMEEVGIHVCREQVPLHHVLAGLFECKPQTLHQQLCQWVLRYHPEVHIIEKWLAIRGLNLAEYLSHLESDKACNGLELWLLSLTSDRPFNVVMEDRVFSSGTDGVDFDFPTIVLLPLCEGILCELDAPDEAPMAAALPWPSVTLLSQGGGH